MVTRRVSEALTTIPRLRVGILQSDARLRQLPNDALSSRSDNPSGICFVNECVVTLVVRLRYHPF